MIAFDLICSKGHKFECWFKDSASFDHQKSSGLIYCPVCDDNQVEKSLSPFGVKRKEKKEKRGEDLHQALQKIHQFLDKHFEDVGLDFTKEALKIHYGESKKRNIKGTATSDQEKLLEEEGVQFMKVPVIKRLDD